MRIFQWAVNACLTLFIVPEDSCSVNCGVYMCAPNIYSVFQGRTSIAINLIKSCGFRHTHILKEEIMCQDGLKVFAPTLTEEIALGHRYKNDTCTCNSCFCLLF